jgi:hypothetical protein
MKEKGEWELEKRKKKEDKKKRERDRKGGSAHKLLLDQGTRVNTASDYLPGSCVDLFPSGCSL